MADLEEELGDLLFQVYFHAMLGAEAGRFTLADVARGVHDKLVSRHPHVFGDRGCGHARGGGPELGGPQEIREESLERDRGHSGRAAGIVPGREVATEGSGRGHGAARPGRRGGAAWPRASRISGRGSAAPPGRTDQTSSRRDRRRPGRTVRPRRGARRPALRTGQHGPVDSESTPRRRCGRGRRASGLRSKSRDDPRLIGRRRPACRRITRSGGSRVVTLPGPATGVTTYSEHDRAGHRPRGSGLPR